MNVYQYIIDYIDELHDEFLMMNVRKKLSNLTICGSRGKTLTFAEVARLVNFVCPKVAAKNLQPFTSVLYEK